MNTRNLIRAFIVIIIIIGGIIIIIIGQIPKPDPPPCIVCGANLARLGGIAEVILGIAAFAVAGRINDVNKMR
jgi:hypothetical protein